MKEKAPPDHSGRACDFIVEAVFNRFEEELEKLFYVPLTDLAAGHALFLESCLRCGKLGNRDAEW
jgi:hypothetical protein